jgi:hypothetical protein
VIAQLLKIQYARPDVGLGRFISVSCKHRRDRFEPRRVGGIDAGAERLIAPRPFPHREIEAGIEQVRVDETLEEVADRPRDRRRRPRAAIRNCAVLRTSHASSSASSRSWRLSKYQ